MKLESAQRELLSILLQTVYDRGLLSKTIYLFERGRFDTFCAGYSALFPVSNVLGKGKRQISHQRLDIRIAYKTGGGADLKEVFSMPILGAIIVPHPPIIIPTVGRRVTQTMESGDFLQFLTMDVLLCDRGNIGVPYTYNEPLVSYEYVRDCAEEIRAPAQWLASISPEIPLQLSRFFPRYRMTDRPPTSVEQIYQLAETAREYLSYVYTGNC